MPNVLIIPVLNPDDRLIELVNEIKAADSGLEILIVDDGSGAKYRDIFAQLKNQYGCTICHHPENYGKGAAIKTGIDYAQRNRPNWTGYITADADGQHLPEDILKVSNMLADRHNDLILGTRDFSKEIVPFKSRWGNRITSSIFRLVGGFPCHDTQTGLRGFSSSYGDLALAVSGERFEYEMNFLLHFSRYVDFVELPIETVYTDSNSSSHFHPVRDAVRIYRVIFIYWLSSTFTSRKKRIKEQKAFINDKLLGKSKKS